VAYNTRITGKNM